MIRKISEIEKMGQNFSSKYIFTVIILSDEYMFY